MSAAIAVVQRREQPTHCPNKFSRMPYLDILRESVIIGEWVSEDDATEEVGQQMRVVPDNVVDHLLFSIETVIFHVDIGSFGQFLHEFFDDWDLGRPSQRPWQKRCINFIRIRL